jgi:large subunit ribosomal protein L25
VADISNVALGASLHVRDIAPPDGVQILTDPDEVVLSVVVPQVLKVEEEVPAAAAGEEPVAEEAAATPEAPAPPEE